jgi:hypothetical protein
MTEEEPLDSHVVELLDTRPYLLAIPKLPQLGEVPMDAGLLLFGIFGCAWMLLGWKYLLAFPVCWYGAAYGMRKNYHALNHFGKYIELAFFCLDKKRQRGISVTPCPYITNRPKGML